MLKKIDHIGVVVDDLAEAQRFLGVLGMELEHEFTVENRVRAAFYQCGDTNIELIEIVEPEERSERLGNAKARIEHIGIEVDDLSQALVALAALGVEFKSAEPLAVGNTLNVWTRSETCAGVMYQFIERVTS